MTTSRGGAGFKVIAALAVLGAGLALAWMLFLPQAVSRAIRRRTGFGVAIQSLYCNPLTANLELRGMVVTNPPAFPRKEFLNVRELRIDGRPGSLLGGRWEVNDATVDLAEIAIVRDGRGRVNVRLFQEGLAGPATGQSPTAGGAPSVDRTRNFLVRHLAMRIDRVVVADYAQRTPETRVYNLQFHHDYANVTSVAQLAAPLAGVLDDLAGTLSGAWPRSGGGMREAEGKLQEAGLKTAAAIKGLFESLEKSLRK